MKIAKDSTINAYRLGPKLLHLKGLGYEVYCTSRKSLNYICRLIQTTQEKNRYVRYIFVCLYLSADLKTIIPSRKATKKYLYIKFSLYVSEPINDLIVAKIVIQDKPQLDVKISIFKTDELILKLNCLATAKVRQLNSPSQQKLNSAPLLFLSFRYYSFVTIIKEVKNELKKNHFGINYLQARGSLNFMGCFSIWLRGTRSNDSSTGETYSIV
jgi:hypothetical protein